MATPAPAPTPTPTPTPTTTTQADDNHLKTLQPLPSYSTATTASTNKPPASTSESGETKSTTGDSVAVTVNNSQNDGDSVQKKILRAERFGMPVQLSEQEKRNSRAQRFGMVPSSQGSVATKKAQELKLKARAERFGIKQSMSTDENEKKKARLARFASASITDPQEEQKKKARALRFSGTQFNGSGNIESKTTITGKAVGEV